MYNQIPRCLCELFVKPNRICKDIQFRDKLGNKTLKNLFLSKILNLYNGLKPEMKLLTPIKFRYKLSNIMPHDGFPN